MKTYISIYKSRFTFSCAVEQGLPNKIIKNIKTGFVLSRFITLIEIGTIPLLVLLETVIIYSYIIKT